MPPSQVSYLHRQYVRGARLEIAEKVDEFLQEGVLTGNAGASGGAEQTESHIAHSEKTMSAIASEEREHRPAPPTATPPPRRGKVDVEALAQRIKDFDRTHQRLFDRTKSVTNYIEVVLLAFILLAFAHNLTNSLFGSGSALPVLAIFFFAIFYLLMRSLARVGDEYEKLVWQLRQRVLASFAVSGDIRGEARSFSAKKNPSNLKNPVVRSKYDVLLAPEGGTRARRGSLSIEKSSPREPPAPATSPRPQEPVQHGSSSALLSTKNSSKETKNSSEPGFLSITVPSEESADLVELAKLHILLCESMAYFADHHIAKRHCWTLLGTPLTEVVVKRTVSFILLSTVFAVVPALIEKEM